MVISPELKLATQCCRWSFAGGDPAAVTSLYETVDWSLFLRVVRFHRIDGLVWNCLASVGEGVPPPVVATLSAAARGIAAQNLRSATECRDLRDAFEAAGVPLLFVKGLTVAALAYQRSSIKSASDIDLLIPAGELDHATALLRQRGYELAIPRGASRSALQRWHRVRKESVWEKTGPGLEIDLHTRLADSRWLIPTVGIGSPRQLVEVARGIELATLGNDQLFAYLAVHGASSAWFRLKWITDLAALVSSLPSAEIERLYRRSQELGAGRAATQALLVADRLYGTLASAPNLKSELGKDRASRWLAEAALHQVAGKIEPVEPTSVVGGTATIHFTQFLLLRGLAFKASELVRQVRSALA